MNLEDFDLNNILRNKKSNENILIYDISYETLIGPKPFQIRFDKRDGFFKVYDESKYLVLLGPEKNDTIYNRIRYLISLKSSVTYIFSHYFVKIKVCSHDSLPIEKSLTLQNVKIKITTSIRYF